jgi:hypothetical protein
MLDKILYAVDKIDMPYSYYNLFYHPWISQKFVLTPALILLAFDEYLVICNFLALQ